MKLYQVQKLISKINHNIQLKNQKQFIHYNYTLSDIELLSFLLKQGYITSFEILNNSILKNTFINKNIKKALKITLKLYNNKFVLKKIKHVSTPGKIVNFKCKKLRYLYNSQN
jgi:ribosomal protein S8